MERSLLDKLERCELEISSSHPLYNSLKKEPFKNIYIFGDEGCSCDVNYVPGDENPRDYLLIACSDNEGSGDGDDHDSEQDDRGIGDN